MFSPSAVIMKSLRSVKIEFGIFFIAIKLFFQKENKAKLYSNGWFKTYNSLLVTKRCTRPEFCVIRKIFVIFLIQDYIMDRNGTKAAGYFSLNVPAKKDILKIIYTIVFHCCQWNYK